MHRAAPELRQQRALDALVLDVLAVNRRRDGRNRLVEREGEVRVSGIPLDLEWRAVAVAGRLRPLLPLAAIHRHLHGESIGALERLVRVQQRLDGVGSSRDLGEAREREAIGGGADRDRRAGPVFDIDAEDLLPFGTAAHLEARLAAAVLREDHEQAAVDRRWRGGRELDAQRRRRRLGARRRRPDRRSGQGGSDEKHARARHAGESSIRVPQVRLLLRRQHSGGNASTRNCQL
jgi:hypothetical protein